MKAIKIVVHSVLTILLVSAISYAGGNDMTGSKNSKELTEKNLLVGLSSDNFGLRVSSAYFLGELKSEKAIIPLMKMLRSEEDERGRIMAALSLIKIENSRGIYMVKRSIEFNEFERVRDMCEHLYKAYLVKNHYEINNRAENFV
jgi:hypothetical protein